MTTYDVLPYDTKPSAATHPDGLFAIAHLHGLEPAPVETCRVLEVGCGTGHNLIPMAAALPHAQFVGVDLSPVQIALGREAIRALGLENLDLQERDLREIDSGPFDYVICHGVYSWVPPEVQDALLAGMRQLLAPHGVAFISWNALPGWKISGTLRELLRWQTQGLGPPAEQVAAARDVLADLVAREPEEAFFALIQERAAALQSASDTYLLHDFLAPDNRPRYHHEFCEHAAKHGLCVMSEAEFGSDARRGVLPTTPAEAQLTDFLQSRSFRRSVLCRDDASWQPPEAARVLGLNARSQVQPGGRHGQALAFTLGGEELMATENALLQSALTQIGGAYPRSLPVAELSPSSEHAELVRLLFTCATHRFVQLFGRSPAVCTQLGPLPQAWGPARLAAATAQTWVPNLLHQPVAIDPFEADLLCLLDGTRGRDALLEALAKGYPKLLPAELALRTQDRLASLVSAAVFEADGTTTS